ncbi:unnamed protein product, partial [Vitis vinifera]
MGLKFRRSCPSINVVETSVTPARSLYLTGLWKRSTKIRTLHTLINGGGEIMNMCPLGLILFWSSRGEHPSSVMLTSCVHSETISSIFLVTPLKSKWGWDHQVSSATLHIQSKMGHGNSQALEHSSVMTSICSVA